MIYLDTHVVAWLYVGEIDRFPSGVCNLLEKEDLLVSPMVLLELQYLYEIGRTTKAAEGVMEFLQAEAGLQICSQDFATVIQKACELDWTRDPFDRIIVATASLDNSKLISKDKQILQHYIYTMWE